MSSGVSIAEAIWSNPSIGTNRGLNTAHLYRTATARIWDWLYPDRPRPARWVDSADLPARAPQRLDQSSSGKS